ncbi:MAG: YdcF family protein [Pseudomonadota bacterium]
MFKTFIKISICCFIAGFSILFIEAAYFYRILTADRAIELADVVVVFHGAPDRNNKGYQLVNHGYAPYLIISPASTGVRTYYDIKYARSGVWRHLVEDRADSTFQNALLAGRLIREHQLAKVILVTDSWHMPRSSLLLRMMLVGEKVSVFMCETDPGSFSGSPFRWSGRQCKMVYNEAVELWGSMIECVSYLMHGKLPEKSLKTNRLVEFLKSALLFEVT